MAHTWTDAEKQAIADQLRQGLSAQKIAAKLPFDITRNAICGVVHRDRKLRALSFVKPVKPKPWRPDPVREKKPAAKYDAGKDGHDSYYAALAAKKARGDTHDWEAPKPVSSGPRNVPLAVIQTGQCKWPLWAGQGGPDFIMCGADTVDRDASWCQEHAAMAYARRAE